jgi:hypothetical protein
MTNLELILNMLAEATTTEISKEKKPKSFNHSKKIAKQGGTVAGNARKEIETKTKTGKKVVSRKNAERLFGSKVLGLRIKIKIWTMLVIRNK